VGSAARPQSPEKFINFDEFEQTYGGLQQGTDLSKLHETLSPLLLRRVKKDVEKASSPSHAARRLAHEAGPGTVAAGQDGKDPPRCA
jgi:hypothetical protein